MKHGLRWVTEAGSGPTHDVCNRQDPFPRRGVPGHRDASQFQGRELGFPHSLQGHPRPQRRTAAPRQPRGPDRAVRPALKVGLWTSYRQGAYRVLPSPRDASAASCLIQLRLRGYHGTERKPESAQAQQTLGRRLPALTHPAASTADSFPSSQRAPPGGKSAKSVSARRLTTRSDP